MDGTDLKGYIRTVELGSIAGAAKDLYISTQALDTRLRKLEAEVGVSLLIRSNKGVSCTAAGKVFCEAAINSTQYIRKAIEECRRLGERGSCRLCVGIGSIVPSILLSFQEIHPEIEIDARYLESVNDPRLLMDGTLDLIESADFICDHDNEQLLFTPVTQLPMRCLFAPNHALARKQVATIRDLAGQIVYIANPRFLLDHADEELRELMKGIILRGAAFGRSDMLRCKCEGGVFIVPKFSASVSSAAFQMKSIPFDFRPTTFGLLTRREMTAEEKLLVDFYKMAFAGGA